MVYPVLIPAPSCIAACFPFFKGTFYIATLKMLTKYPPGPAICLLAERKTELAAVSMIFAKHDSSEPNPEKQNSLR